MAAEDKRLDRIENKIDKLADAVVALARDEEKLINIEEDIKTLVKNQIDMQTEQDVQDEKIADHDKTIGTIRNVFWIVFSCILTTVVAFYVQSALEKKSQEKQEPPAIHAPADNRKPQP